MTQALTQALSLTSPASAQPGALPAPRRLTSSRRRSQPPDHGGPQSRPSITPRHTHRQPQLHTVTALLFPTAQRPLYTMPAGHVELTAALPHPPGLNYIHASMRPNWSRPRSPYTPVPRPSCLFATNTNHQHTHSRPHLEPGPLPLPRPAVPPPLRPPPAVFTRAPCPARCSPRTSCSCAWA